MKGGEQLKFDFNSEGPKPALIFNTEDKSMEKSEKEKIAEKHGVYGSNFDKLHKKGNDWYIDDITVEEWKEVMKNLYSHNDGDYKNY